MEALAVIFALLLLLSVLGLVISLVVPGLVNRLIGRQYNRKRLTGYFSSATLASFILFGFVDPDINDQGLVIEREQTQEMQDQTAVQDENVVEYEESLAETESITTSTDVEVDSVQQTVPDPVESETVRQTMPEFESQSETITQTTEVLDEAEDTNVVDKEKDTYHPVVRVVDGDTIRVDINGTEEVIRLIGIDTPELVDPRRPVECFAQEASQKANELLANRLVRVVPDPTQSTRDVFGRLLAYVYRDDGLFFNKRMIETGYAFEYTYRTPYQFQQEFKEVEQNARINNLGLWSPDTCAGDVNTGTVERGQGPEGALVGNYYTSAHHSARYYYPRDCSAWHSLVVSNLRAFDTLEELLQNFNRTRSPQCQ